MNSIYAKDRFNARNGMNGKDYYPNVVFPTDKDLQQFEYPFKSGYYFNPVGVYTCTVKTVLYKDSMGETTEHKQLVEKAINAFHFQSGLLYTKDGKDDYQSLDITGTKTSVFDTKTSKGIQLLDVIKDYKKDEPELLEHTTDSDAQNGTDARLRQILEGYGDSNTADSKVKYLYKEYVKEKNLYKLTETTVITFKVMPQNGQKLYTHAKMANGKYNVNVWVDNLDLNDNGRSYAKLKKVEKVNSLDKIQVTVTGSIYDDVNN
jgi:hypothetical protein